jgi:hypothetical protein
MEDKKYTFIVKNNGKEVLRFEHLSYYTTLDFIDRFCNKWVVYGTYKIEEEK